MPYTADDASFGTANANASGGGGGLLAIAAAAAAANLSADESGNSSIGGGGGGPTDGGLEAGSGDCPFFDDVTRPDYALLYHLHVYVGSLVVALGCVGHLVTIASLLCSRQLRRQSLTPFLLVMSAAGLLALLAGLAPHVVEYATCERTLLGELDPSSDFGCRLLTAARYYGLHLYSWTEALVAAERLVAVRWPLQCKRWLSRRASVGIAAAMAAILLPVEAVPFVSYGYDESYFCNLVKPHLYSAWPYAHLAVYCLAPVAVMLPSNALTLSAMRRSEFDSATLRKAKPVTVMMMSLNCVFLVTAAPFMVVEFVRSRSTRQEFAVTEVVLCVCRVALYAGSASTIFVYAVMAAKFRKTLRGFAARSRERLMSALSLPSTRFNAALHGGRPARSMSYPNGAATRCPPSPHTHREQWTTIG